MQRDVNQVLRRAQERPIDFDVIAFQIGLAAELGDSSPVNGDAALQDELFGLSPGCDSGARKDLL